MLTGDHWRTKIRKLIVQEEAGEAIRQAEARRIARFILIDDELYKRGFVALFLKCLLEFEA